MMLPQQMQHGSLAEPTPPVHDYPSTHSALGNAAATVMAKILGDNTPFTMTSFTAIPQVVQEVLTASVRQLVKMRIQE